MSINKRTAFEVHPSPRAPIERIIIDDDLILEEGKIFHLTRDSLMGFGISRDIEGDYRVVHSILENYRLSSEGFTRFYFLYNINEFPTEEMISR